MSLSLDRKAFIDILTEGEGDIGGVMQPPPSGLWGMPPDLLRTLRGYVRMSGTTAPWRAR
jgi:peptide/nickel transport system substrate-binding protein